MMHKINSGSELAVGAARFDGIFTEPQPFSRFRGALRRALRETCRYDDHEPSQTEAVEPESVGQVAVQAAAVEAAETEGLAETYLQVHDSSLMRLTSDPDGTMTASSFDLGPTGSLL